MARKQKQRGLVDLENCQKLMQLIEHACNDSAALGSEFVGRSWCLDDESHAKVAEIYKGSVETLRAAFRGLSVAEEMLEQEAASQAPARRPGVVRRLLLGGA